MITDNFQKENDMLLNNLITKAFLNKYKPGTLLSLELFITPTCNLSCKYCYLNKYGKELYPSEIIDEKTILNNIIIILNYLKDNNCVLNKLNIFSGEIWSSDFGFQVLEIIYNEYKKYKFSDLILIPSNMTFLLDNEAEKKIQNIIDKFEQIGVSLRFSASIDGKILEENMRPFKDKNKIRNDEYYDKVFTFCKNNRCGFHPMVSSKSCKYWIENFKWFKEQHLKYGIPISSMMMLEVRNDDWTEEDINYYLNFLDYLSDDIFYDGFHGDKEKFAKFIFFPGEHPIYNPITLHSQQNQMSCSIQNQLFIRVGDLSLIPCHRTCYPNNIYGKFIVKDNKIVDIVSQNVELANFIYTTNPENGFPTCAGCKFKYFCIKGCLGSQYETSYDILLPNISVCEMLKSKLSFLYTKYEKMGLIDILKSFNTQKALVTINKLRVLEEGINNG